MERSVHVAGNDTDSHRLSHRLSGRLWPKAKTWSGKTFGTREATSLSLCPRHQRSKTRRRSSAFGYSWKPTNVTPTKVTIYLNDTTKPTNNITPQPTSTLPPPPSSPPQCDSKDCCCINLSKDTSNGPACFHTPPFPPPHPAFFFLNNTLHRVSAVAGSRVLYVGRMHSLQLECKSNILIHIVHAFMFTDTHELNCPIARFMHHEPWTKSPTSQHRKKNEDRHKKRHSREAGLLQQQEQCSQPAYCRVRTTPR